MDRPKLTPEMERVLAEARAHGDWFSISHHPMSPVRARHQTVKALWQRGFLQRVVSPIYRADVPVVARYNIQYKYLPMWL